jgi:hypothetical protein
VTGVASLAITTAGLTVVHAVIVCPHGGLSGLTCCGECILGQLVGEEPDCPECLNVLAERRQHAHR